jgi:hypothetical protein
MLKDNAPLSLRRPRWLALDRDPSVTRNRSAQYSSSGFSIVRGLAVAHAAVFSDRSCGKIRMRVLLGAVQLLSISRDLSFVWTMIDAVRRREVSAKSDSISGESTIAWML